MRHFLITSILFLLTISSLFAQSSKRLAQFNLSNKIAIQGYDPVAYFKQGKAVKGSSTFAVNVDRVTYNCSSAANKALLQANPAVYEPQFGGWCAYAMGKSGEKVEIDPETFKIVGGKLYLFYNAYFNNTLTSWNKDEVNLKRNAELNWKKFFN